MGEATALGESGSQQRDGGYRANPKCQPVVRSVLPLCARLSRYTLDLPVGEVLRLQLAGTCIEVVKR